MKSIKFKTLIIFAFIAMCSTVWAVTIESQKQEIRHDENKGYFSGDVKVTVGDVVVTSPRAELDLEPKTKKASLAKFFDKPYAIQFKNNKKHEVKADIIKVSLIKKVIRAEGNAQTNVLENKKPTIIITADAQEYDTNTHLMSAEGSVVVNYEDMVATADKGYALMDKGGDVQNLKLVSRATIKQDKSIIKGDNIQYSRARQDIIVTGHTLSDVTFESGDRVIVYANSQQYSRPTNVMMATGAVRVKYSNYIADGPKAIMYMNKTTNKPDKIVFLGRSKIVEKGANSVEADRITIVMNPKTFEAVGKVKTVIEQTTPDRDEDEMEFSL